MDTGKSSLPKHDDRIGNDMNDIGPNGILSVSDFHGEYVYRGIPINLMDNTGHIPIWNVSKMFGNAAGSFSNKRFFSSRSGNPAPRFVRRQHLILSPLLHSGISDIVDRNIFINAQPGTVGKSSKAVVYQMTSTGSDTLLAIAYFFVVHIDRKTRKSTPYPEWFLEKFRDSNFKEEGNLKANKDLELPLPSAFQTEIKVRHSDTDANNHVNNAEYIKFCFEAATDAARSGYYRQIYGDISLYPVLELDIIYISETRAGEMVDVFTWQDKNDDQIIYFSIRRQDVPIAVCVVKFAVGKATSVLTHKL